MPLAPRRVLTLVLLKHGQRESRNPKRSSHVDLRDSLHLFNIALTEQHRLVVREPNIVDQHGELELADLGLETLVVGVSSVEEVDGYRLDLGGGRGADLTLDSVELGLSARGEDDVETLPYVRATGHWN